MGDKRIALCLSGIVGGKGGPNGKGGVVDIKTIFNQYQKHILDKNNVDVFIHSWSIDYEEILSELYNPKLKSFENQITFHSKLNNPIDKDATHRFYSRWNSIKKTIHLKKDYEELNGFEYDVVMLSRLDLLCLTDIIFIDYDPKYFWVSNWNTNGPRKLGPYGKQTSAGNGFLDFWFFSNSPNMDKFSYLYDDLESKEFFKKHSSNRLSGHVVSKQYANILEFDVKKTMYRGFDHEVFRRYNSHCGEKI